MVRQKRRQQHRYAAFIEADVATRVRMATRLARAIIMDGAIDLTSDPLVSLQDHLKDLVGHDGPDLSDDGDRVVWESQEAAYALGIAVGLLLRPEAFATGDAVKGGAR